jgi:hypothetical protein
MAAIASVTAGSIYFRSATIWGEWLAALRALPDDIVPVDIGNFSLALIVRQLTGRHASAVLLLIVVAVTLFVAFRRRPARAGDTALIALGCVGLHLVSRLVWLHYYVLAIPLIMWLLRPAHGSPAVRRQIAGGVALLLIAVRPWDDFVPTAMQVAMLVNAGLLLAFGATLRDVSLLGQDGVKTEPERQ